MYTRPKHRPTVGAELAGWFNENVYIDLFFLWQKNWLIIIDEATRYKIVGQLESKRGNTTLTAILKHWLRYFGPMRVLTTDQEGGIKTDDAAQVCDKYSIIRRLKGSYGHTATGLAERHIELTTSIMLKGKADVEKDGLTEITDEDLAFEAGMAQNIMLEYGGFTPCQCVLGHNPRGYYEFEADTLEAHLGATSLSPDIFEQHMRARSQAKQNTLQSVVEQRIARAEHSRPQKVDLSKLKVNEDDVDLYRIPDR